MGNTSPSYRTYSYYMDGSVNRVDDDSTLYVYSYDSMGRLYMEEDYRDDTGYELDFAYDRFGNRESLFAYNVDYDDWYEIAYTYDLNNRLIREDREDFIGSPGHTAGVTATTYTYDGNGSQLTKTTVDGAETRTYNGFGQLEGITGPSGSASFAYRPDGLRYRKTTGSGSAAATHIHLWDGQNIVAEVGATGALNTRYIRGTGLIAREMDGALQYYLFDAHGDVLHRLDASGNMLRTYRYDAFGNEIDPEPLDTNPFRYCGEYFDREIGTYYLRARNYDPRIGRFTTEDPARKDLNYYVYGRNNPIKFTDPTGMASRIPLNNYYDSQEYQDFVKGNKKDPWDIAYHQGRTAVTFPIKENTNGRTYPGHGNSKDFIADKGTTIHAATGGIVDRVDWGYADDYTVRGFKNDKGQISYYEVDASGNIKRDNNGAPIIGNPYGNSIRIRMADDSIAIYAHMSYSESAPVEVGNYVFIDAPIGQVGNTGNSFGSHLHFEIRNGADINTFFPEQGG